MSLVQPYLADKLRRVPEPASCRGLIRALDPGPHGESANLVTTAMT